MHLPSFNSRGDKKEESAFFNDEESDWPLLERLGRSDSPQLLASRAQARSTWIRRPLRLFSILVLVLVASLLHFYTRASRSSRLHQLNPARSHASFSPPVLRPNLASLAVSLQNLSAHDLIAHSLLTSKATPNCTLAPSQLARYAPLHAAYTPPLDARPHFVSRSRLSYLVAINLYNSEDVLPSLIRALASVFLTLGPTRFHLSIYENGSTDSTPSQLVLLSHFLDRLGVGYTIVSDPAPHAWEPYQRIPGLARLRNAALEPLVDAPVGSYDRVIFLNDVVVCEGDLLEIILQHEVQEADMSCGMDWKELRIKEFEPDYPVIFYDEWVARDILGLPFYHVNQPKGDWSLPAIMPLPAQSPTLDRLKMLLPFQAFSCWNGIVVLDAALFLPPPTGPSLRFRSEGPTDAASECKLFCHDVWKTKAHMDSPGNGTESRNREEARGAKIMVVPRASVAYELKDYERKREDRNTAWFEKEGWEVEDTEVWEKVEWVNAPPKNVVAFPFAQWDRLTLNPPYRRP